jgi:hypothetical protein
VVELAGHSGLFDYVELVGEYAPCDLFALENLARAETPEAGGLHGVGMRRDVG